MELSFVTRKFQRSIAGLSLLAILASFAGFGTASAMSYSDVDDDHFAVDQIDALSDAGIMTGYEDGTFGPDDVLTREQATKILVLAFVGAADEDAEVTCTGTVSDWATSYVATANLYGIMEGEGDGSCNASGEINRAAFAKMVVNAAGLASDGTLASDMFDDVEAGAWYDEVMGTAYVYSVMGGYENGDMGPGDSVTRGQSAKMTYNAMYPEYIGGADDDDDDDDDTSDATVTVEVSDDTPESATIPSNATSVELASFDFTAEGDDAVLDGFTIHQFGISSIPSAASVYLYEGSSRLTNGTSVNSSTYESEFRNLDLALEDGETRTLTVRMDMGDWTSSGEVGFEIESADMVDVNADVEGDFPAMGDKFSVSTTDVGSITIEKNGTVENAQVGEDGATVAKFKLSAGSAEGALVQEIGLYVSGTISTGDVENFNLYVTGDDSEPIAQVDAVDDLDVVRFVVGEGEGVMDGIEDGYEMADGASKSFYVTADFNTGRTDDTWKMYVDQDTDVVAIGDLYGYGLSVSRTASDSPVGSYDGTSCTSSAGSCSYMTLEGGDVTVTSNGPTADDIAVNADGVVLMNFTVTSIADVTFDNFPVALTASESGTDQGLLNDTDNDSANFTNITLVDNDSGDDLYSSVDATAFVTSLGGSTPVAEGSDAAIAYYLWSDDWEVKAGAEYDLSVQVDIKNDTDLAGMTLEASLPFTSSYPVLKDVNNKVLTNSSVLVPTSSITGKTMTVQTSSLEFSLASSVQSDTYVKGSSDVRLACFSVQAGSASEIELDELTLTGSLDENLDGTYGITGTDNGVNLSTIVPSVWLEDGEGNELTGLENVTSSGTVVFQNMNLEFSAAQTMILCAVTDISDNGYQGGTNDRVAFGISSASNVSATDADGSTLASSQIQGLSSALNVGTGLSTASDVVITVSGGGILTADLSSGRAREDIIVAGASDVEIGEFKFSATDEDFVIDRLSVFNRYSTANATSTSTVGAYDDNVTRVVLEYTDSNGDVVESDPIPLTKSNVEFEGLDILVPQDGDTTVTIKADLQTVSSGADAGDFVEFGLALNNFRATAEGSGETYDAQDMDDTDDDGSILDEEFVIAGFDDAQFVNTVTYTNDAADLTGATTVGSSASFSVDNNTADQADLAEGTLLCMTDAGGDTACDVSTDDIYVVTAWVDGATEDTVTATLISDEGDGTYDAGDEILYAVPGQQYLSGAYQMVVYETVPTLALASSSPSGSRTVSATDQPFVFTVSNYDNVASEDMQVRAAQINHMTATTTDFQAAALSGTWAAFDAPAPIATQAGCIGNTGCLRATNAADTSPLGVDYTFDANANLSGYNGISFWVRSTNTGGADTVTLTINDTAGTDQTVASAALANDAWQFVDLSFAGMTSTDLDAISALNFRITDNTAVSGATLDLDRVVLYYEKVVVDVTTSSDVQAGVAGSGANNLVAYLKEGGTTLATGYWYASATQTGDVSTASVTFYPETDVDQTIEIAAGDSKTFTLQTDTASLLEVEDEGTETNGVTFSMDLGSSASGTVTAGDFWWFDSNATAKWLGYVASTTLSGNTLTY